MKVISIKTVAEMLGVHQSTVRRWLVAGIFVSRVQLGKRRLGFREADVVAWVEGRRGMPA